MNGFIICNKLSKKHGNFFYNPYLTVDIFMSISLFSRDLTFSMLPTYLEIILTRHTHTQNQHNLKECNDVAVVQFDAKKKIDLKSKILVTKRMHKVWL